MYLDKVFLNIKGRQCYLWRAVDQDDEIVDAYLQPRRDAKTARRFLERGMRKFKSLAHSQRFVNIHAAVYNLFNLWRHLINAEHYRLLQHNAFASWKRVAAV